jgi:integrase/recombinase XerD
MVTYKLALDERRAKQNGTFPLVVRVTYNRKVIAFQTGVYLLPDHWNKNTLQVSKTNANWSALSHKASELYVRVQKAILSIENEKDFTFEALKDIITPRPILPVKLVTFKSFSQSVIDDMIKVKRTGGALVYLTAVNRLISYCNNPSITFNEIDYSLLDGFKNKLLEQGLKKNSVGNYFRSIRALYNKAIKAKVVARELYPFHDIAIKTEKTAKRAIRIEELIRIYEHPKLCNTQEWHAANYFFLSFTLRGISFTDMAYLKPGNIQNGCIVYRRRKTQKLYTIKLHSIAELLLNLYKRSDAAYLLPILPNGVIEDSIAAKKITRQWIKITNKYLNRIAKASGLAGNITTYVIRHTWATISKKLGYSNEMIAEGMGHEYGNKITNIYLDDFDQCLIDEMNDRVVINVIPCPKMIRHKYRFTLGPSVDLSKYKFQKAGVALHLSPHYK